MTRYYSLQLIGEENDTAPQITQLKWQGWNVDLTALTQPHHSFDTSQVPIPTPSRSLYLNLS